MLKCSLALALAAATLASPARAQEPQVEQIGLAQAIDRALKKNPTVAVAREEIARVQALVREVRAGSLPWTPTLYGNGTYTHLDDARRSGGALVAGQDQLSLNLTLNVPLVMPQRWVQIDHAQDQVRIAEVSAADIRRQLGVAVARAYLAVVTQHRVLEVNERARQNSQAHLDFARTRLQGGVGNKLDEVRAAQDLSAVVSQLEGARATLAKAQETLGVIVAAEQPLDALPEMALPDITLDRALSDAETTRTDIRALRERKTAADRVVHDSWADYAPLLNAVAQPFYQHPSTLTTPGTGWQAQLLLTIPLYDGGLRYGLHDERVALASEARENLDGAIRQARAEVRGAFTAVLRADDALKAGREGAQLAQEALQLASLAYKQGAVTNLEVIDAERRARDADTTVALAEDTARSARLDLLTAAGTFP